MSKKKQNRCKCGSKKMYKNCCGKEQASKKVKSIGQGEKDPADNPSFSIKEIAKVVNANIDGDLFPMLIPHNEWEDYMDFDRNAAKLGFEQFVRPRMKCEEFPQINPTTGEATGEISHIVVTGDELIRTRLPIFLKGEDHG